MGKDNNFLDGISEKEFAELMLKTKSDAELYNEFRSNYLGSTMPKSPDTKRIEVHLLPDIVKKLKALADKENRSLKNYIETLLIEKVSGKKNK